MKMFTTVALIVGCLLGSCTPSNKSESPASEPVTLYFMTFEDDTYTPTTKANIRMGANKKWVISDSQRVNKLVKIITSGPTSTFQDKSTRAVVEWAGKSYFIDQTGNVEVDGNCIKMDLQEFLRFHRTLRDDERRSIHQ